MELHLWLSLVVICTLGAMSPGPSIALVIKNTLNGGKKQGYITAISHGLGVALYAALTSAGIGIIIVKSPMIFTAIQYTGAVFLCYLGVKSLFTSTSSDTFQPENNASTRVNGWRDGFLIAFLNPKLVIFFLALFSQFVDANALWLQKVIMTVTAAIIDMLWYIIVTFTVSRGSVIKVLQKYSYIIDKVTGLLLILIAIRVIFIVG